MLPLFFVSMVVGYAIAFSIVWLFDPAIGYFDKVYNATNYTLSIVRDPDEALRGQGQGQDLLFSIVVPAYNEEQRMDSMLSSALLYMSNWSKTESDITYEVVIVDDGSTDKTFEVAKKFQLENVQKYASKGALNIIRVDENIGKGGAVRIGVDHSLGKYILMVDADGATDFKDISKLYKAIKSIEESSSAFEGTVGVAIGSRAHLQDESVIKRSLIRTILMKGFHSLLAVFISTKIRDTQCGFKLFTQTAAKKLFGNLHVRRWAFDVELIYLCDLLNIPIAELAVEWHEVEGSKLIQNKLDIVTTSLTMARDIICIRLCYLFGIWKTNHDETHESANAVHLNISTSSSSSSEGTDDGKGQEL